MDYRPPGSSVHRNFQARVLKWVAMDIQKTKIMASGPITSWEIDGETVETVRDFIFGGFKITADDAAMKLREACSLEEKL